MPGDRGREFNTQVLQPYKRTFDLEVIALYSKGTSTRKIADILKELFTLFTEYNKSYYRYDEKRNSTMAEYGQQEILGFYINPNESATSWEFILIDL